MNIGDIIYIPFFAYDDAVCVRKCILNEILCMKGEPYSEWYLFEFDKVPYDALINSKNTIDKGDYECSYIPIPRGKTECSAIYHYDKIRDKAYIEILSYNHCIDITFHYYEDEYDAIRYAIKTVKEYNNLESILQENKERINLIKLIQEKQLT